MIEGWEHHELRRARRDLYHLTHETGLREAHAAKQAASAGSWLAGHDFRAVAMLADVVEGYAATSRTGSRPPDAPAIEGDGTNAVVLELATALRDELLGRLEEADGVAKKAVANLLDKAEWAVAVLSLRA